MSKHAKRTSGDAPTNRATAERERIRSDWALLNFAVNAVSGASWVSFHHGGGVGIGYSQHAGQVIVCDGTPPKEADERIKRVLTNDLMMGIFRHADAGYDLARQCADELGVKIPMR